MDSISRENNSMLPVGGIIVGVIALLLGGYSAIKLSSVNRALAAHEEKLARLETAESQTATAAASAEKAVRDIDVLRRSTQDAFNQVATELGSLRGGITKLEETAKAAPAPRAAATTAAGAQSSGAAAAGPGEYIVKSGDTGAKIARERGILLAELQAANPDVNWNRLAVGQRLKLPQR